MIRHPLKLVISIFLFVSISYASDDTIRLIGTWKFGQIRQSAMEITRTWVSHGCKNMPYDVIYHDGDVFQLSVKAPAQCYWLGAEGLFLHLRLYFNDEGMEVRTCFSRSELAKLREDPERLDTSCSWETASRIWPTPDADTVYRQFQEAINRGEVDAAVALLDDDVFWLRPPACQPNPCRGKPRIRQEIWRQIGDENQARAFSVEAKLGNEDQEIGFRDEPKEGTVLMRYELRSESTRMRGFERRIIIDTVTVRDGKIISIAYGTDMNDQQTAAFEAATALAPK